MSSNATVVKIEELKLSKTNQLILETFAQTHDWEAVKKKLKVTEAEVSAARRIAVNKARALLEK
jgi:hypothetical protein